MFKANLMRYRAIQNSFQSYQSQCKVLRNQLGFNQQEKPSRPITCQGCLYYHGKAYGQNRENRTILVCAFHPYGWTTTNTCPDWKGVKENI